MTTEVKQLKGFVSAPAGTDLSHLLEVLQENGIHVLDPAKFAPGAVKITDKLIDGIGSADLVIAVLGTAASSGNVLFELGCASALDKKTLVIAPEDYELPSDVKDLVYIRTTPNNREAVRFALEQILNAPEPETSQTSRLLDKTQPLGSLVDELLSRLEQFGEISSERDLVDIVRDMLRASGVAAWKEAISTQMNPSKQVAFVDFAVWIDELEPYLGNPIIIEVKRQVSTPDGVANQVLRLMSLMPAMGAVILSAQTSPRAIIEALSAYPNLYFFDLRDLLNRLRQESLGQIIRNERNARVHGMPR